MSQFNIRARELNKFSENASQLLLERGGLPAFFEALAYEVEHYQGGYRGICPVCNNSRCFIGTNGVERRIYWKCYDASCESNRVRMPHSLLTLVRRLTPGNRLDLAINTIAKLLGYEGRSYDITNGKFKASPSGNQTERETFCESVDEFTGVNGPIPF